MKRVNQKGKGKTMVTAWMLSILMAVSPCTAYAEGIVPTEAVEISSEAAGQEVAEAAGQEVTEEDAGMAEPQEAVEEANPQEDEEAAPNAGGVGVDEARGILVLFGEVDKATVQSYAKDKRIDRIMANDGAVLPKDCSEMFMDFTQITSIDLSKADSSNIENMNYMFYGCEAVKKINLAGFNTENVTTMKGTFSECEELTRLEISSFNTKNVSSFSGMFRDCKKLKTLDVSSFETDYARSMDCMFMNSGVTSLDLSGFNTQYVYTCFQMFYGCDGLTTLDLSSFYTPLLQRCEQMFAGATKLKTIYVSSRWNTGFLESGFEMFLGCTSLVGQNGTSYDANFVGPSYARVDVPGCPGYFTSGSPVKVIRQPQSVTCDIGDDATFSVDAQGAVSYKWCVVGKNGYVYSWPVAESMGWGRLVGTSDLTNTLKLEYVCEAMDGCEIFCEITGKAGYVTYTDYATIHVTKKVKKLFMDIRDFDKAYAGTRVETLMTGYLTDVGGWKVTYGTVTVEWSLFGMKLTKGALALHDNVSIRFGVDLAEGYEFADTRVGYMSNPHTGNPILLTRVTGPETATHSVFVYDYQVPAPEGGVIINEIRREIADPVSGEELPTELVALSRLEDRQRNYTVQSVSWVHQEWEGPGGLEDESNEMALGGDEYRLEIVYKAKADYCFTQNSRFYINGEGMRIVELTPGKGGTVTVARVIRVAEDVGTIWSASASFASMIEINFYCEIPKRLLADENAYVTMKIEDENPVKILVKDAKTKTISGHETKIFSYPVVAKKLRENVVFRLYDGRGAEIHLKSGSGTDYNYNGCPMSIVTYCDMVVEKSSDKKMVALAKAVKDYGTAAQLYFGYKADGLSVSNRVKNLDKNKVIDGYSHVITGEMPSGFAGFKNMTLALESATELRIYMGYDENVGPGRFAYAIDGTSTKVTKTKDGQAYLSVMNIAAKNLDKVYTFTVKGGTKTVKLKASALSYAALLCKQTKNKPVNLGKAMYLYNVAAKEYFAK